VEKKYWRSLDELQQTDAFVQESSREFAQELPIESLWSDGAGVQSNRRDFLKYWVVSSGFGGLQQNPR